MKLSHNMYRMRQSDIERLTAASVKLGEVAATIKATRTAWASLAVQGLREVNETILALRDRALNKMHRIVEKQNDQLDKEARKKADIAAAVARGMGEKE